MLLSGGGNTRGLATSIVVVAMASVAGPPAGLLPTASTRSTSESPQTSAPSCNSQFDLVRGSGGGQIAGLAAVSRDDVWAVGTTGSAPTVVGFTEHWNGTAWSQVSFPNSNGHGPLLSSVTAVPGTSEVWTVGSYPSTAARWNGAAWIPATLPTVGGADILNGVAAVTASDVWAVGFYAAGSLYPGVPLNRTRILHYDGTAWSSVNSADPSPTSTDELKAVSFSSATDGWAVGISEYTHPLIEHWDGTTWTIVPSPTIGAGSRLRGISALSPSLAWAVGDWSDATTNRLHTLIEKWDGYSWSVVPSPDPALGGQGIYPDNYLYAVAAVDATSVWVVGTVWTYTLSNFGSLRPHFAITVAEHWDGLSWRIVSSANPAVLSPGDTKAPSNELHAIAAVSPADIWAAGSYSGDARDGTPNALYEHLCIPVPNVTGVAPISGNSFGGGSVIISGSNLSFTTGVNFGLASALGFTVDSDSQVTASVPGKSHGDTMDITVTTYGGTRPNAAADKVLFG